MVAVAQLLSRAHNHFIVIRVVEKLVERSHIVDAIVGLEELLHRRHTPRVARVAAGVN